MQHSFRVLGVALAALVACNRPPAGNEGETGSDGPDPSWAFGELFMGGFGDEMVESQNVSFVRIDPNGSWVYGGRGCNGTWESEFVGVWEVMSLSEIRAPSDLELPSPS